MNLPASSLLLFAMLQAAALPEAALPYFTHVREVRVADAGRQNFFVVDKELWAHSRPDLGDLRLFDGETPVQYALSEQRAGISSEEVEAKIFNLGNVSGHTEFDLDAEGIAEYDHIHLRLDAHDFVTTAAVSGGSAPGNAATVELPPTTLYDFTREQLGSNSLLKLPSSSFRYLHVRLGAGILPQQLKGATIYNLREQHASWTKVGSCAPAQAKQRTTVIACAVPARVPLSRVLLQVASAQVNFLRTVSVEDANSRQIASGEVSRVRVSRGGTLVTAEELAVNVGGNSGSITLTIDNGDNPPLAIQSAQPLSLERRIYFDPQGKTILKLYYGDEKLSAPVYDYARFFRLDAAAVEAELLPGAHNQQFTGRPDERPWSERHTIVLWGAMLLAVLALGILAVRGLRPESPR
jgi:hypothetical protein